MGTIFILNGRMIRNVELFTTDPYLLRIELLCKKDVCDHVNLRVGVADPNSHLDPQVYEPPGSASGSLVKSTNPLGILHSSSKNSMKNPDFYCFVTSE
jgi:hypothetical protein